MSIPNRELQLANDFVQYTGSHIFLTGKAGTGKTTFLRNLQKNTPKRMIVTAPTGVAAINAGGVTLHSFFQLPFGPFIPGSEGYDRNNPRQFRFSKEKKQIIKSLDLLVIDEISMVRADLLDAVDAALRRHRGSELPFGGVQLLMIGDLHQLSPVAKPSEWKHLQQYYDSVYFFSSKALAATKLLTIELKHIYRQSDKAFIELLNKVRTSRLDEQSLAALNARYRDDFIPEDDKGYITLTTHNRSAEEINSNHLEELESKKHSFHATIKGDFPEHIFPTQARLIVKVGAQVMFMRNDLSTDKRYYNGKIGTITSIIGKTIFVKCEGEKTDIEVDPVSWENIKYTINDENKEIEEDVVGKFEQYPLKLAWAITIHKSQGLTFERAIIDAEAAFAHGQVYVALSRCKTLEGMVLRSPIRRQGVGTDEAVLAFDAANRNSSPSEAMLLEAKINYQQQLLLDCFDFSLLSKRLGYLLFLLHRNRSIVQLIHAGNIEQVEQCAGETIFSVSENFKKELQSIFSGAKTVPETDGHILERARKASGWFSEKIKDAFGDSILVLDFETDNKELRKKISNVLNNTRKEIEVKLAGVQSCAEAFTPAAYLSAVAAAEVDFKEQKVKKKATTQYSEEDIAHPELFALLRNWRDSKAEELEVAKFQVLHQRVLVGIVVAMPETKTALRKVSGVGKMTIKKYGDEIMAIIDQYREEDSEG